tara:strand:- start:2091 stop:2849 length:759 start_codon:yes stop_codon:yes gene_type:complete
MLLPRLIPTLLLRNNGLVKTIRMKDPKYIGDPINAIKIFNEKEVDELILLDILATKENREPNYKIIEKIAGECFMPLTYGGGINSIQQAKIIFSLGVEKICLHTAAIKNMNFVSELSSRFGSQSIVISVDIKRNFFGSNNIYCSSDKNYLRINTKDYIKDVVKAGAGEILLHSISREGTLLGPDLDLIKYISSFITVPLINLGGISSLKDIKESIKAGSNAVAAGSFFVLHGPHRAVLISYPDYDVLEKLFI